MARIPDTIIDEIQARVEIADVIGQAVPLKRAGRQLKALCPFHKERTPSFIVNPDKQVFHCFGCGVGGNVFSFLMQHDRLTFPEAVRQLAEQVGLQVPDTPAGPGQGTQERLRGLMEQICRYYERTLLDRTQGAAAQAYLRQRGVSEPTQRLFRLGLAPAGWEQVRRETQSAGVALEDLEAAGLVIRGRTGAYDRFRHRLIFPISDVRGRVIAFGGRVLPGDQQQLQAPKYLNSPETVLYSKGRTLYGLAQAREAIIAQQHAVVVEGYLDCVGLAEAGIRHVVSPLGTALTVEQARLLKRYATTVILAFDADAGGEAATIRGIELLVEAGFEVRVAQLPSGKDPDEHVRAHGRAGFEQVLTDSVSVFEALIRAAMQRADTGHLEGKVRAAEFVLPIIAKVPNAMLRSEYVRLLAARLRLEEGAVTQELAKCQSRQATPGRMPAGRRPLSARNGQRPMRGPEWLLAALVLDEPSRWERAQGRIALEDVVDPTLRRVLEVIDARRLAGQADSAAHVVSRLAEEGHASLVAELAEFGRSIPGKEAAFEDCLRRVRRSTRTRQLAELRAEIRRAQEAGLNGEVQRLLAAYQQQMRGDAR